MKVITSEQHLMAVSGGYDESPPIDTPTGGGGGFGGTAGAFPPVATPIPPVAKPLHPVN